MFSYFSTEQVSCGYGGFVAGLRLKISCEWLNSLQENYIRNNNSCNTMTTNRITLRPMRAATPQSRGLLTAKIT